MLGLTRVPFSKVKSLISDRTCRDERTSKATEKKENLDADTGKRSSTHETAVSRSTEADRESANEGHPDEIYDQTSDVVIDACLTCDAKYKVASETCVKDNTGSLLWRRDRSPLIRLFNRP